MVVIGRRAGRPSFGKVHVLILYSVVVTVVAVILWGEQDSSLCGSLHSLMAPIETSTGSISTSSTIAQTQHPPVGSLVVQPPPLQVSTPGGTYTPVDCKAFVQQVSVDADPKGREKVLVRTDTANRFLMALHKREHDKVRWDIVEYGRYYERKLEDMWAAVLRKSPAGSHVVDVGGNVGYYSLFSASLGEFVVDSFEPNPTNILRFCESIGINHWSGPAAPHISIWEMGISDRKGMLNFQPDVTNPGAGKFVDNSIRKPDLVQIQVTTLDDWVQDRGWFQNPATIAILKIDVERHEAQVIQGAKRFLQSHMVQNIFTEVGGEGSKADQVAALQVLVDAGYHLVGQGNFRGPGDAVHWPENEQLAETILNHLEQKGGAHPFLNLWWSLDATQSPQTLLQ